MMTNRVIGFMRGSATAVLLAAMVFGAGCGGDTTGEANLARALEAYAGGDNATATIELKNALQKNGRNAQARFTLGKIYLESGQILEAEKELGRARDLGVAEAELAPLWAKVLLPLRKFDELADIEVAGLAPQAAAQVLATQALGLLVQGKLEESSKLIEQGMALGTPSNELGLAKARLHGARGEKSLMREAVQEVIDRSPDNQEAWTMLGDIALAQGDLEAAESAYGQAIEVTDRALEARLKRTFVNIQQTDYDAAQSDLDLLMGVAPHNPGVNYAQGLVHFYNQSYEKAVTAFAVAEREKKRYPLALLFAGTSHFMLGNKDQAEGFANQFHAVQPDNVAGAKLLATILLGEGDYERVEALVSPVVAVYPNDVAALNLLANSLMSQGEVKQAVDLLARVAEIEPDSSAAQIRLGAGMLVGGAQGEGVERLQAALELNPEFQQADILLILNHLQRREYEDAITAAKAYRLRNPTAVAPYNLLGRVYTEAGEPTLALESFQKALAIDPGDPAAHGNLARLALQNDDAESARQHYESILEHHNNNLGALLKLAELEAGLGNRDAMVERLTAAMEAHPAAPEPRVLMARYYLATDRPQSVPVLFAEFEDNQKNIPAILNVIALSQLAEQDYAAARYTLEQLERLQPGSAQVQHQMAMAQAGLNDTDDLAEQLEKALELDPDYLPSRLALARLLVSRGEAGAAGVHLQYLKKVAPDFPDVLLLEAAIASLNGDTNAAAQLRQRAFEVAPTTTTVTMLAATYMQQGQVEQAIALQESWLEENTEDLVVRLALAEYLTNADRTGEAIGQYETILETDDSNLVALNNLAWYLLKSEPELALRYAERANNLMSDSADILDTLALAQLANAQGRKANRTINRALQIKPGHPTMLFHSAQIKLAVGDSAEAQRILQGLIDGEQEFAERQEAQALLETL